jgi:2-methylaconitate cis-trans-isomerase PrpF
MEAEKTEKAQKMKKEKKKKTPILVIRGTQSQGHYFSEEQEMPREHVGPRRQVQPVKKYGAPQSLSVDSQQNFPGLRSQAST